MTARLYLALPPETGAKTLAGLLDAAGGTVDCVRFSAESDDAARDTAAAFLAVTEPREIALLIEDRVDLVRPLKLDGVHLASFTTAPSEARQALGPDLIVGAFAGASQHRAMVMAEMGADYVALGPVADVDQALFEWWSATIETPLVAECVDAADADALAAVADFLVPDPAAMDDATVAAFAKALGG